MNYCIVEDGVIINIIVCENDDIASLFNALPGYDGADIGAEYNPAKPEVLIMEPTQLDRIEAQITYTALMTNTLIEEGQ